MHFTSLDLPFHYLTSISFISLFWNLYSDNFHLSLFHSFLRISPSYHVAPLSPLPHYPHYVLPIPKNYSTSSDAHLIYIYYTVRTTQRTYRMFRTLGLRHLCVINKYNQVLGIVTRADLVSCCISSPLFLELVCVCVCATKSPTLKPTCEDEPTTKPSFSLHNLPPSLPTNILAFSHHPPSLPPSLPLITLPPSLSSPAGHSTCHEELTV